MWVWFTGSSSTSSNFECFCCCTDNIFRGSVVTEVRKRSLVMEELRKRSSNTKKTKEIA